MVVATGLYVCCMQERLQIRSGSLTALCHPVVLTFHAPMVAERPAQILHTNKDMKIHRSMVHSCGQPILFVCRLGASARGLCSYNIQAGLSQHSSPLIRSLLVRHQGRAQHREKDGPRVSSHLRHSLNTEVYRDGLPAAQIIGMCLETMHISNRIGTVKPGHRAISLHISQNPTNARI